jgi:hypothetical protein
VTSSVFPKKRLNPKCTGITVMESGPSLFITCDRASVKQILGYQSKWCLNKLVLVIRFLFRVYCFSSLFREFRSGRDFWEEQFKFGFFGVHRKDVGHSRAALKSIWLCARISPKPGPIRQIFSVFHPARPRPSQIRFPKESV